MLFKAGKWISSYSQTCVELSTASLAPFFLLLFCNVFFGSALRIRLLWGICFSFLHMRHGFVVIQPCIIA